MKETKFIEQNKENWENTENIINDKSGDVKLLKKLLSQITYNLSFTKTSYPNRSVKLYLNDLAVRLFHFTSQQNKIKNKGFINFISVELPYLFFKYRKELMWSFIIFFSACFIGVFSTVMDSNYPQVMLSESYIEMTEEFINSGDPMKVYKNQDPNEMFYNIGLNNLLVAAKTFLFGIFFSLGSIMILFYNGAMVGAFQYFFIQKDLAWESALTIWMHGAIEIPAIIIAGAAGLILGKGLLFPGSYSRFYSFIISAKHSSLIFISLIPFIVFAAFIESYITRHTELNDAIRLILILSSLFIIVYYFFVYPYLLAKKGAFDHLKTSEELEIIEKKIIVQEIDSENLLSSLIRNSFLQFKDLFKINLFLAFLGTLIQFLFYFKTQSIESTNIEFILQLMVNNYFLPSMILLISIQYFLILKKFTPRKQAFVSTLIFSIYLSGLLVLPMFFRILAIIFFTPFMLITISVMVKENISFINAFRKSLSIIKGMFFRFTGFVVGIGFISFLVLILINTPFMYFLYSIIESGVDTSLPNISLFINYIPIFIFYFILLFISPLIITGSLEYYNIAVEINEATELLSKIKSISKKKKAYDLELE